MTTYTIRTRGLIPVIMKRGPMSGIELDRATLVSLVSRGVDIVDDSTGKSVQMMDLIVPRDPHPPVKEYNGIVEKEPEEGKKFQGVAEPAVAKEPETGDITGGVPSVTEKVPSVTDGPIQVPDGPYAKVPQPEELEKDPMEEVAPAGMQEDPAKDPADDEDDGDDEVEEAPTPGTPDPYAGMSRNQRKKAKRAAAAAAAAADAAKKAEGGKTIAAPPTLN